MFKGLKKNNIIYYYYLDFFVETTNIQSSHHPLGNVCLNKIVQGTTKRLSEKVFHVKHAQAKYQNNAKTTLQLDIRNLQ